jgi:purine-binding chemotaxis protein CheW
MRPHRHRHDPSKTLVGFLVGDVSYAVPIALVREISNPHSAVALPDAPPSVIGVTEYRGDVIPVIDMRMRFGLPTLPPTRKTKWIVVTLGSASVALVVDAVTDVFGTAGAELSPPPPLGGGEERRSIVGVTTYEGRMVFVLDVRGFNDDATRSIAVLGTRASHAPKLQKGSSP